MYACRMPDSSELKKPIEPSGERKGWMWAPFCQEERGFSKTLEVAQRVLARLAQVGEIESARRDPRPGVGDQPLAGDVGGEVVEVRAGEARG